MNHVKSDGKSGGSIWPIVLITTLFFLWGMANNLNDILIPQFKKAFQLTDLKSGLVQSAFYMGYFLVALPAGFLMRRLGYKAAVITGLLLFAAGAFLFYPAAEVRQYNWFLGALFVIAAGLAFLETSANPLMTILGDPKHAAYRLNLAQAFNPLGSLAGIWIGKTFILSGIAKLETAADFAREAKAVQIPYLVIACVILVWAILAAICPFPKPATSTASTDDGPEINGFSAITRLFSKPHFLAGVAAQFFYVGAQVGLWSYTIRYAQSELGITDKAAADYVFASLVLFAVGRFVGSGLLRFVSAPVVLTAFAIVNIALTAVAATLGSQLGLYCLVAASFFMSIMFPTIFATSVRELGPLTKTASSLLVMSIVGGAVLTAIMGRVSDASHIRTAIFVPVACFIVIALYGVLSPRSVDSAAVSTPLGH